MATALATASLLTVTPFRNRSGSTSWRVSGSLVTGRVRRNFKTETAAQAFANKHTPAQKERPPRPVITHASEVEVRALEAALLRLPAGTDLLQAVDFFAEHHRPLKPLPIGDAIAVFSDWQRTQRKCDEITIRQREIVLTDFTRDAQVTRSDRITVHTPGSRVVAWIYSDDVGTRTQRDRFDLLNMFCAFLTKKKLAAANPIGELDRPVHRPRVPGVFTFLETWSLLQCALTDAEGPDMLPFFAVCALSGVRPDEVPRLSAGAVGADGKPNSWADIYLDDEHRLIEVNKAKGGRSRRNAHIGDALGRILSWCKAAGLAANYFSKRKFDRIRKRAGLYERWEKDVLRHTYASHHYIVNQDVKFLEKNMGNSERVLFQNYIRPVARSEGVKFQCLCLNYSAPREKAHPGGRPFLPNWKKARGAL